jgi:hypothetical protein
MKESAPWKGKSLSEEHKQAISEGGSGVSHNLTGEERIRRGIQGRRVLSDNLQNPEVQAKIAASNRRRAREEPLFGLKNPETRRKSLASRIRNGTLIPPGAGRGICGHRKDLPHYTRSTTEANFSRILIASGVLYSYEPKTFLVTLQGRKTYYTPDFFLEASLLLGGQELLKRGWVEIKGWRHKDGSLPGGAQNKLGALQAQVSEPVQVLTCSDPEWKALRDYWKPRLAMWETQRRNFRTSPDLFQR